MNNQIHIKTIRALTPEEIARKVEEELTKLNGFASPITQDLKTFQWISFIYYRTLDTQQTKSLVDPTSKLTGERLNKCVGVTPENNLGEKPVTQGRYSDGRGVNQSGNSSSGGFKLTNEVLERWKKTKPTKKTLDLLKRLGFPDDELKNIKTQLQAHQILENLKEENI